MPKDIELRLVTDNQPAVRGIKEVAAESQKLHKSQEEQNAKRKSNIEKEVQMQKQLSDSRTRAANVEHLKNYNRMLDESKKKLQDYSNAGAKMESQGNSIMKSMGSWALGFASVAGAVSLLKDAFAQTEAGLRTFNAVAAVTKQVLYDLVSGNQINLASIMTSIKANKELESLRVKQRNDIVEIAKAQRTFNEVYFVASDRTKTATERLQALNQAMLAHEVLIEKKLENAKEELHAIELAIAARPKETKLLDAHAAKLAEIETIEGERFSETRRLESQRTGIIKEMSDKEIEILNKKLEAELKIQEEFNKLSLQLLESYNKAHIDSLTGVDKLRAIREFSLKQLADFRKQIEAMGTITPEQENMFVFLGEQIQKAFAEGLKKEGINGVDAKNLFSNFVNKQTQGQGLQGGPDTPDGKQSIWDLLGLPPEAVEELRKGVDALKNALDEIYENRVDDAERNRELTESRLQQVQQELETEIELYKAGYASNVAEKQKEIDELKAKRDKALKDEQKAVAAQRKFDSVMQTSSLVTASANIFKALSKLGPAGIALAIGTIASMFTAFAVTKAQANKATKLAKGGHGMVSGRLHSEGGEAFLDHVEVEQGERWGVLSRSASRKYGKIFGNMVDSFNKEKLPVPKGGININNISVQNDGPNKRLDEVNNNLRHIRLKEEVSVVGNKVIYKKGNTIRVVKR